MKKTGLLVGVLLLSNLILAQPSSTDLLGTANQQMSNQWGNFQGVLKVIGAMVFAGGLIYALYCYVYDQSRMKTATISLIAGALILAIGAVMGYLS